MAFRKTLNLTLALSAAAIAGFIAFQLWHQNQNSGATDSPGTTQIISNATSNQRPHFELSTPEGELVSSQRWNGKPLLVNFWATWCAPCRREIPMLKDLQTAQADAGLQLIGIALDSPEAVQQFGEEMQINYPVLVGEQDAMDVANGFGMDLMVLPGTVFSLSDGRTLYRHIGELHAEQAERIIDILWQTEKGSIDFARAQALLDAMN